MIVGGGGGSSSSSGLIVSEHVENLWIGMRPKAKLAV